MKVYIVTCKQLDIHCPIVVQVTSTAHHARQYIAEQIGGNESSFSTQHIDNGVFCYGQYHFPYQRCTMIYFAEGHDDHAGAAYAVLKVELDEQGSAAT